MREDRGTPGVEYIPEIAATHSHALVVGDQTGCSRFPPQESGRRRTVGNRRRVISDRVCGGGRGPAPAAPSRRWRPCPRGSAASPTRAPPWASPSGTACRSAGRTARRAVPGRPRRRTTSTWRTSGSAGRWPGCPGSAGRRCHAAGPAAALAGARRLRLPPGLLPHPRSTCTSSTRSRTFPWPADGPALVRPARHRPGHRPGDVVRRRHRPEVVADLIDRFPAERRADLYSGAGLAATYAGGVDRGGAARVPRPGRRLPAAGRPGRRVRRRRPADGRPGDPAHARRRRCWRHHPAGGPSARARPTGARPLTAKIDAHEATRCEALPGARPVPFPAAEVVRRAPDTCHPRQAPHCPVSAGASPRSATRR